MPQPQKIFLTLLCFIIVLSVNGQSEIGFNVGYIKPVLIIRSDNPHYTGSANYSGSFFATIKYIEKATNKLYLGINLSFDNYRLDFIENSSSHFFSGPKKEIKYNFNYLYLDFYPEWVFGNNLKFYFNTGISFGILLNSSMSGIVRHCKRVDLPDDHWYYECTDENVNGSAREDLNNINIGIMLGVGLRRSVSDNWSINIDISGKYIPFPVDSDFAEKQIDLLISAGVIYTIFRNKKPLLFRSGS